MQGLMMDYPLTIDRVLEHANRMYSHKQISTRRPDGSMHRYTYAALYRRVKRLARALVDLGVQPAERVATFSWNCHQHVELYYAVPCCGAVLHPLNIRLTPDQLAYVVNHAEDTVIFVDAPLLPRFEQLAARLPSIKHVVIFNQEGPLDTSLPDALSYEDLIAGSSEDFEWPVTDERAAMGLSYTSGTTGNPRGVLYSHRSMYLHTMAQNQANAFGLSERDIVLIAFPQFHAMAWGLPYACAFAGADMVLPGPGPEDAGLLDLISEEQVTVPAALPTAWSGVYRQLQKKPRDLWHVRTLVAGGEAMPRSLIEALEQEFSLEVMQAWGMTELSPLGTVSRISRHHADLPQEQKWDIKATQGQAIPGFEVRIVNDQGERLPWNGKVMGELQVCGPWVAKAYYRDKHSAERFTPDGWFRTGDVATITRDGYVWITDRTKDLVRSGGEWISSVALETQLMNHPKVKEAAVIAIPDERWGERPLAVVVLEPDAGRVTADEFADHLAAQFPMFWLPDDYVLVDEIPRTSTGRFDKKELRRRHAAGELGA